MVAPGPIAPSCAFALATLLPQLMEGSGPSFSQATTKIRRHGRLIFPAKRRLDVNEASKGGCGGRSAHQHGGRTLDHPTASLLVGRSSARGRWRRRRSRPCPHWGRPSCASDQARAFHGLQQSFQRSETTCAQLNGVALEHGRHMGGSHLIALKSPVDRLVAAVAEPRRRKVEVDRTDNPRSARAGAGADQNPAQCGRGLTSSVARPARRSAISPGMSSEPS